MKPVIALVGRPNVGKSTIFNRIVKKRTALVDDMPGVTRDRHYSEASWNDVDFTLIDTGGFLEKDADRFALDISFQVRQAIEDADIVVLVLDGKGGVSPFDNDIVTILRLSSKPVFYIVNKIDGISQEENLYEFYGLGLGKFGYDQFDSDEPGYETLFPVSGEHGYGFSDFLDELVSKISSMENFALDTLEENNEEIINIAVVGRPNTGKSSLINKILGEKRLLVSNIPGTTRDSIDTLCTIDEQQYRFIDTAGIRRKGRVSAKIEKFSIIKSLKSLERCDVALILIDSSEGVTDQDVTIAGYALDRGCGCIFLLNKWDIVNKKEKSAKEHIERLRMEAKYLNFAPAITLSALTGLRVRKIFGLINDVYKQYIHRIGTGQLNQILEVAVRRNEPSLYKGKRLKLYYITQVSSKPPAFIVFVNFPDGVHFSYKRYLINQIREKTGLDKTPLKLLFRLRTGRIDFAQLKNEAHHGRNKGKRDKLSKNKLKKEKLRKKQSVRKSLRGGNTKKLQTDNASMQSCLPE